MGLGVAPDSLFDRFVDAMLMDERLVGVGAMRSFISSLGKRVRKIEIAERAMDLGCPV